MSFVGQNLRLPHRNIGHPLHPSEQTFNPLTPDKIGDEVIGRVGVHRLPGWAEDSNLRMSFPRCSLQRMGERSQVPQYSDIDKRSADESS